MNLVPTEEHISLARIHHPQFMRRPVCCPNNELFFYAASILLEGAHTLHLSGQVEESNVLLDAIMSIMHIDPMDSMTLSQELLAMGFHVAAPITGVFRIPDFPPPPDFQEEPPQ